MRSTKVSQVVNATCENVYQACLDSAALAIWRAPDGMTGEVHDLEPFVGGKIRVSLTYANDKGRGVGKTSTSTDTCEGTFVELVLNEKIVEKVDFEADNSAFSGTMTVSTALKKCGKNTEVTMCCEGIPSGISLKDNETGTRQSLRKLAGLFE